MDHGEQVTSRQVLTRVLAGSLLHSLDSTSFFSKRGKDFGHLLIRFQEPKTTTAKGVRDGFGW